MHYKDINRYKCTFKQIDTPILVFKLAKFSHAETRQYIYTSEKETPDFFGIVDSMVQGNDQLRKSRRFPRDTSGSLNSTDRLRNSTKEETEGPEEWSEINKTVENNVRLQEVPKTYEPSEETAQLMSLKQYPAHLDPDRFKFIYRSERISRNGTKINFIAEKITWRHSLEDHNVCNSTDPFILAIVVSSVANIDRREYIRRTWGNPWLYPYTQMRCLFIIGMTTDKDLQEDIEIESEKYNDIIQYNYIDLYETMTYKSVALMTWAASHCPQASFVAKIDDDVMMNPFAVSEYFKNAMKNPAGVEGGLMQAGESTHEHPESRATLYVYGRYRYAFPLRFTKWGVTWEEYPEEVFPLYTSGPAYVFGREALKVMVEYIPYVPYLKLEDVFTTGLLSRAAQINLVDMGNMVEYAKTSNTSFNKMQIILMQTEEKSRKEAWEGVLQNAPVNLSALGTPWT
ncbi:beta-1,3-galactosyltransferase bre-2-like [Palaemon carinicauda]|uniref:beta-1,3-galactosyltransferase bre-2-like n=1 Tax=Palaemon carinicauda TaxID=392227 RepID=UPI0035B59D9A